MVETTTTEVAVGMTDGYRYVAIAPPLTDDEVHTMEAAGILQPHWHREDIVELQPHCTMITVSGDADSHAPPERTRIAGETADKIAAALRESREGVVRQHIGPVALQGHNSSPFNPNTDRRQEHSTFF